MEKSRLETWLLLLTILVSISLLLNVFTLFAVLHSPTPQAHYKVEDTETMNAPIEKKTEENTYRVGINTCPNTGFYILGSQRCHFTTDLIDKIKNTYGNASYCLLPVIPEEGYNKKYEDLFNSLDKYFPHLGMPTAIFVDKGKPKCVWVGDITTDLMDKYLTKCANAPTGSVYLFTSAGTKTSTTVYNHILSVIGGGK
jgi:hypothetical protein